jgi:hypothetical protein
LAVGALVALVLPFSTRADAEAQALAESPAGAESAGDVTGVRHGDPAPRPTAIPA